MNLSASIVIASKNRRDELEKALQSAVSQIGTPEVIVVDDGSTDGTSEMVRARFPSVHLERSESSFGYIVQRNRGAALAKGDIIFSIDDDAEFTTERVVAQTLEDFDDSRIGAVAIPYREPLKDERLYQSAPDNQQVWVTSQFKGTAYALRRNVFLTLGGYRENLIHQGEEGDYAVRMLAAGYATRLGRADPITHWESANRDHNRMDFYGPRNNILFVWQNVPWPILPIHLIATTVNCLRLSFKPKRIRTRSAGILAGYRDCLSNTRRPVSRKTYRLWRQLRNDNSNILGDIEFD